LFTSNSVNFTFYDENSPTVLLTGINISLDLINGGAQNLSTVVGWVFVDDLVVGDIEARYGAPGFNDNNFFFTITNRSTQSISLFLSNSSLTELYKIVVIDLNDKEVVGATVRLQKQMIELDGQFVTISECNTNSDGECFMTIEESTSIVYRFIVIIGGETIRTTEPSPIITLAVDPKIIRIRVNIGANLIEPLQQDLGILASLNLSNNVSTYDFIDSFNAIVGGCLRISKRIVPGVFSEVNESCVLGTSGSISINYTSLIENDSELLFEGLVNYTDSIIVLISKSQGFEGGVGVNRSEADDLFLTLVAFLIVSFAMVFVQNIFVQIIVDFGLMIGIVVLGLNLLGIPLVMTFLSLGLFITWDRQSSRGGVV
jgi:hypothetical protein